MKQSSYYESVDQGVLLDELMEPQPIVIGLEGGPCSGKTTLTEEIERQAATQERPFMALPEAATIHLNQLADRGQSVVDLIQNNRPAYLRFEADVLATIIKNIEAAKHLHRGTDAIILVDRVDIGAYVEPQEYRQILADMGQARAPINDSVDKLIFLPSVASEQPERYIELLSTNGARYETSAEQAAAVCAANLRAVRTHPELQIAWGGEFGDKIKYLAAIVLNPELEAEIKQGVPNHVAEQYVTSAGRKGNLLNVMAIEQSYHLVNGQEFRLRSCMGDDGLPHKYFTIKTGEGAFRQELQRSITAEEYALLKRSQQVGETLLKMRHVVLDDADSQGKRRLWYADRYITPPLDEWHFETEVQDEDEIAELTVLYGPARQRITESARTLISK